MHIQAQDRRIGEITYLRFFIQADDFSSEKIHFLAMASSVFDDIMWLAWIAAKKSDIINSEEIRLSLH